MRAHQKFFGERDQLSALAIQLLDVDRMPSGKMIATLENESSIGSKEGAATV